MLILLLFGFNSSSGWSAVASVLLPEVLWGNSSTVDPLTGSVLITVCSCWLGKTLCHRAANSPHRPSYQSPSAGFPFVHATDIPVYWLFCVPLNETKVSLSIFCFCNDPIERHAHIHRTTEFSSPLRDFHNTGKPSFGAPSLAGEW